MAAHAPIAEDAPPPASVQGGALQPWPSTADAWKTLWILSLVLGLSQVDRNILSLLLQSIKHDLKLSDSQMGLLIGAAFSILYLPLSFPLSLISDRKSRKTMIAMGVGLWSLCTAACGLATSFWTMFAARAGLGAGESVNGPATYSLLGDSFPREKLPRAMAVLNVGFVAGTAFSLILGSVVIVAVGKLHVVLPVLGDVKSWQLVFFALGLPGLLVAALMLTVREPARRGVTARSVTGLASYFEVFGFLKRNACFYGCLFLSVFFLGVITYGSLNFRAAFFQRTYHWAPQQYGLVSGIASLIVSPLGLIVGTWLCERWNRRHHDGNMRVALFANLVSLPFAIAGTLMPNGWLSVACSLTVSATALVAAPPLVAAMQSITPSNVRAQVNSLYLLLFSGITGIVGPWFIGWLTDMQHDETKLRYVIAVASAIALPISVLSLSFALKPFGRMIEQIKADEIAAQG